MSATPRIYPILLAAGPSPRLGGGRSIAKFDGRNAIQIAMENCTGLARPVVVLGHQAAFFARHVPAGAKVVVNRKWRVGQLGSLLAGLQHVPRNAAFLLYPVDHAFLTPHVIRQIVRAYERRKQGQEIFMPRFKGRSGHPVIISAKVRPELDHARTAREVVYRDARRIRHVPVRTRVIWKEFEAPAYAFGPGPGCADSNISRHDSSRARLPNARL